MATTKKTSAPAARKAPAQKVATTPETKTAEKVEDDEASGKPGPDAPDAGKVELTPEQIAAAEAAKANESTSVELPPGTSADELQKIKDAAYKDGYAAGFEDALDGGSNLGEEEAGQQEEGGQIFGQGATAYSPYINRLGIILLAVKVPENYRKGGMTLLVDQLETYFAGLDPDDAHAALLVANAIADKDPADIASGRFKLLVGTALDALNNQPESSLRYSTDAEDAAAAANRLETLGMPEESEIEEAPGQDPELDVDDPTSGESAAARLRMAT